MEKLIYELVNYGLVNGLIDEADKTYTVNKLMEFFGISDINTDAEAEVTEAREISFILEDIMTESAKLGLLPADATVYAAALTYILSKFAISGWKPLTYFGGAASRSLSNKKRKFTATQ